MNHHKRGFTLTELLIVVIVIGILSAVVLPRYNKTLETRKTTEAEDILSAIRTEQERRCTLGKKYVTDMAGLSEIVPSTQTNNYTYSLERGLGSTNFHTVMAKAISRGSYEYGLYMFSNSDGRICCQGPDCTKLNKDYPLCEELVTHTDLQRSAFEEARECGIHGTYPNPDPPTPPIWEERFQDEFVLDKPTPDPTPTPEPEPEPEPEPIPSGCLLEGGCECTGNEVVDIFDDENLRNTYCGTNAAAWFTVPKSDDFHHDCFCYQMKLVRYCSPITASYSTKKYCTSHCQEGGYHTINIGGQNYEQNYTCSEDLCSTPPPSYDALDCVAQNTDGLWNCGTQRYQCQNDKWELSACQPSTSPGACGTMDYVPNQAFSCEENCCIYNGRSYSEGARVQMPGEEPCCATGGASDIVVSWEPRVGICHNGQVQLLSCESFKWRVTCQNTGE